MDDQSNNVNPYKKYGDLHNKGLDSLIKKLSQKTSKGLSLEQIIETICEYLKVVSGQKSSADDAINFSLLADSINKSNNDILERLRRADLSQEAINLIKELLSIDLDDTAEILNKINEIESRAIKSELNNRDKNYVLLSLAIANASVNYWSNEQRKANSLWKKLSTKLKKIPWKADVEGALGASIDPITDVIFSATPAGPIIIVTKIVGAGIVASAYRYITEAKRIEDENENERIVKARQDALIKLAKKIPKLKPPDK